jgi:hypothetical protein
MKSFSIAYWLKPHRMSCMLVMGFYLLMQAHQTVVSLVLGGHLFLSHAGDKLDSS